MFLELLSFLPGLEEEESKIKRYIILGIYVFIILFWLIFSGLTTGFIYFKAKEIQLIRVKKLIQEAEKAEIERIKRIESVKYPGTDFLIKHNVSRKIGYPLKYQNYDLPFAIYPNEKLISYTYKKNNPLMYHFIDKELKYDTAVYDVINRIDGIPHVERTVDINNYDNFKKTTPNLYFNKIQKFSIENNKIHSTIYKDWGKGGGRQ
ncbi:MAG: hypothetical protein AB1765_11405 [Candidatus Hydrogenedentota bacterium]